MTLKDYIELVESTTKIVNAVPSQYETAETLIFLLQSLVTLSYKKSRYHQLILLNESFKIFSPFDLNDSIGRQ